MGDQNIEYIGRSVIQAIDKFYTENADLDASGTINMAPLLRASKKLELFLANDFEALWAMEREDVVSLKTEIKEIEKDHVETLSAIEYRHANELSDEIRSLQRRLYIMTRCARHLSACFKVSCPKLKGEGAPEKVPQ